jgi:hypothetical protein
MADARDEAHAPLFPTREKFEFTHMFSLPKYFAMRCKIPTLA